jgi:hypothetical protein
MREMSATQSQTWALWVGEQTPDEFMAMSEGQTPEQAVRAYVADCLSGAVWGPVDFDGEFEDVVRVLLAEIGPQGARGGAVYAYDVTVRLRAETKIGTETAAEVVRIALEPMSAAEIIGTAEIVGSAEAGEDAGSVGLSHKRLEEASGGAS